MKRFDCLSLDLTIELEKFHQSLCEILFPGIDSNKISTDNILGEVSKIKLQKEQLEHLRKEDWDL